MEMKNKHIYAIDLVLIIGSLISVLFLVNYSTPLVISPLNNYETTETAILFSIEKADSILIDDNSDFTTPEEYSVSDGAEINLKPGIYYWKAVGISSSETRTLTINSEIDLRLEKLDNGNYDVVNAGNTRLNVEAYNGTKLVDEFKLDVSEKEVSSGNKFIGSQGDENE